MNLRPGEVITRIAILDGCWVDAFLLSTNLEPGAVRVGGGITNDRPVTWVNYTVVQPPEEHAFVVGFNLYVGLPILTGLQVQWGCYKVGGKCVPLPQGCDLC